MASPSGYSAEDIEVLEGLDPVRVRPGMYTETRRSAFGIRWTMPGMTGRHGKMTVKEETINLWDTPFLFH